MKKLFTILFVILTTAAFAQPEGQVVYMTKINMHKNLKGPRAEQMKEMIPEFVETKQILYFNETEALSQKYVEKKDVDEADIEEGGGIRFMRMMGGGDDDRFYTNHEEGTIIQKKDFLGKMFLVVDEQEEMKWKLTGEQKVINGYLCMKAELQRDTTGQAQKRAEAKKKTEERAKAKTEEGKEGGKKEGRDRGSRSFGGSREAKTVTAWFTPQIPVPVGPNGYSQLPGLIIQLEIGGPDNIITATEISLKKLEKGTIEQPKGGKKVNRAEFKKIQKEKIEEMRKERGGRGGRERMIIRH